MSFKHCIERARLAGDIDDAKADDLIARYESMAKAYGPKQAKDKLAKEELFEAAETRRRAMIDAQKMDKIKQDTSGYRTAGGQKRVDKAIYSLFEADGYSGYEGANEIGKALIGMAHAEMSDFLHKFERKFLSGKRRNMAVVEDLPKAAYGEKVSPETQALYDSWAGVAEKLRQLYNEEGGHIAKLDSWGLPQWYDANAVIRFGKGKDPVAARNAFVKWFVPKIDWAKVKSPLTGEVFRPDQYESVVSHAWDTIVTDGDNTRVPSRQRLGSGGSLGNARTDHRFFVFKDADAWNEVNREVGRGDTFGAMMNHLHSMARDIAMMRRFGTNPPATIEWMKQVLDSEASKVKRGLPSMLEGVKYTSVDNVVQSAKSTIDGFYQQFRGVDSAQNFLAIAGTILKNQMMSVLLGSAVIPHAASNWYIQAMARAVAGIPYAKTIPDTLAGFSHANHAELTLAGLLNEEAMFNVGQGARQLGAMAKIANWSRRLPDRTTHWFGLIPTVNANKAAVWKAVVGYVAKMQSKPWTDLPARFREMLAGYGINDRDWRVMQLADLHTPFPGAAPFLRHTEIMATGTDKPDDVLNIVGRSLDPTNDAEAARKASFDVGIKYLSALYGLLERAVPQGSMRAKAALMGKTERGTWWGLLKESFAMFKGFIGSFSVHQIQTIGREMARNKYKGAAYLAALATGMTIGGMISLQLKTLSSGKDMLPMDPTTKEGLTTWAHALLTGGSFGLIGDFLASDQSSFGHGPLETLAGPEAGLLLGMFQGAFDILRNDVPADATGHPLKRTIGEKLMDAGVNYLRQNTPFLSTAWPLRAAYNRIVLDHLQYMIDPHAHQMMRHQEQRVKKETGQSFWWKPGELTPERLPGGTTGHTPIRFMN